MIVEEYMNALPEFCETREEASSFVKMLNKDLSPVFEFSRVKNITIDFVDELCKQLIKKRVDVITVLNASEGVSPLFFRSAMMNSARFLIEFRKGDFDRQRLRYVL